MPARRAYQLSGLAALVVGLFLVYNALSVSVAERRHEIGVILSLGATRTQVQLLFAGEAAFLGLIGSLLGIPLGIGLAYFGLQPVQGVLRDIFMELQASQVDISPDVIVLALVAGIVTAVLAALFPAIAEGEMKGDIGYQKWADAEPDPEVQRLLRLNGLQDGIGGAARGVLRVALDAAGELQRALQIAAGEREPSQLLIGRPRVPPRDRRRALEQRRRRVGEPRQGAGARHGRAHRRRHGVLRLGAAAHAAVARMTALTTGVTGAGSVAPETPHRPGRRGSGGVWRWVVLAVLGLYFLIPLYKGALQPSSPIDLTLLLAVANAAQLLPLLLERPRRREVSVGGLALWGLLALLVLAGVLWAPDQQAALSRTITTWSLLFIPIVPAALRVGSHERYMRQLVLTLVVAGIVTVALGLQALSGSQRLAVFETNTTSISRMVFDSTRSESAGAISPLNWLPGKATIA